MEMTLTRPATCETRLDFTSLFNRLPHTIRYKLENCIQDKIWHPEGSVAKHTQIVVENINKLYNGDKDLLVAAIFHDIGKPETKTTSVRDGIIRISHIGHEHASLKYVDMYFSKFRDLSRNKEKIKAIVENHMKAHLYLNGTIKKRGKREKFEQHPYFEDIIKFSKCDLNYNI